MRTKSILLFFLVVNLSTSYSQSLFKNNDRICFMGNSITHGGRYHSYIYLYYVTRFPQLHLSYVNCGISGDVASGMFGRLQKDIYDNNPTVVTLSAGMNDVNRGLYSTKKLVENAEVKKQSAIESYKKNVIKVLDAYKAHNYKIILFTPTLYDETVESTVECMKGVNGALGECREFVLQIAKSYDATVVDFWKPTNQINDSMQKKDPTFTLTNKDRIHPQPTGHMVMAYLFLIQTKAPKEVWTLSLDAKTKKVLSQQNCELAGLKLINNSISFKNRELALPFPKVEAAKEAYDLVPLMDSLNQQIFKVANLQNGNYKLKINEIEVGQYTDLELAKGVNLALNTKTPQYQVSESIANLCEENASKANTIRTLRRIEIKQLTKLKSTERDSAKAYLKQYIEEMKLQKNNPEANSGYYIMTAQTYLKEIDNEELIKKRMQEIEVEIYKLNQPKTYRYLLEKI
jgi:lysophospholipase L1-like esterase